MLECIDSWALYRCIEADVCVTCVLAVLLNFFKFDSEREREREREGEGERERETTVILGIIIIIMCECVPDMVCILLSILSTIYIYITTPKNTTNVTIKQVDGHEWNRFVGRNLHECIYTPLDYTAFFVGWTSLVFWFCCQIPQFYKVKKTRFAKTR